MKLFEKTVVERHELKSFTGGQDKGNITSSCTDTNTKISQDSAVIGDWISNC